MIEVFESLDMVGNIELPGIRSAPSTPSGQAVGIIKQSNNPVGKLCRVAAVENRACAAGSQQFGKTGIVTRQNGRSARQTFGKHNAEALAKTGGKDTKTRQL